MRKEVIIRYFGLINMKKNARSICSPKEKFCTVFSTNKTKTNNTYNDPNTHSQTYVTHTPTHTNEQNHFAKKMSVAIPNFRGEQSN